LNEEIALLSDTKLPKDHIQNILNVDPAKQSSEGISRRPQILRRQLLPLPDSGDAPLQGGGRLLQQTALSGPRDQPTFGRAEEILGEADQGREQFGDAIPVPR